jgi:hypothetical protein
VLLYDNEPFTYKKLGRKHEFIYSFGNVDTTFTLSEVYTIYDNGY